MNFCWNCMETIESTKQYHTFKGVSYTICSDCKYILDENNRCVKIIPFLNNFALNYSKKYGIDLSLEEIVIKINTQLLMEDLKEIFGEVKLYDRFVRSIEFVKLNGGNINEQLSLRSVATEELPFYDNSSNDFDMPLKKLSRMRNINLLDDFGMPLKKLSRMRNINLLDDL